MRFFIILIAAVVHYMPAMAQFNGPESIDYHRAGNTYFVSNTGSQDIRALIPGGSPVVFVNPGGAPYGLEVVGDTLYACVGGSIKAYEIPSGSAAGTFNLGGNFLNGIAHDESGNLYVSDFSAKKIYKIHLPSGTTSTFVANTVQTPNGLNFDKASGRLLMATWGSSARIKQINLTDSSMTDLLTTPFSNIDGIQTDDSSRVYISPWSLNGIVRYKADLSAAIDTVSGMNKPADIYYNRWTDTLAVPNSGNNTVSFISYYVAPPPVDTTDTLTSVVPIHSEKGIFKIYPNPAQGRFEVEVAGDGEEEMCEISLYNTEGVRLRHFYLPLPGKITRKLYLDGTDLSAGAYLVHLQSKKRSSVLRLNLLP